jgi:translation initiation factor IF-1
MAKDDIIVGSGKVMELLPNALFKIELESGMSMLGHLAGKLRVNNINLILGDVVDIEISIYDPSKCRITYRHKRSKF